MAAFAALMRGSGTLTAAQQGLLGYTRANRDGARYLFATNSWVLASPYILAADARVLPIGGFTNEAPSPTLASLKQQVDTGRLGYVLLSDRPTDFGGSGSGSGAAGDAVGTTVAARAARWVIGSCTAVPPAVYGGGVAGSKLYHCSPKVS
jgi:hypothetical protein